MKSIYHKLTTEEHWSHLVKIEVWKNMNGFQKVATAEQYLKDNRIWSGEDVDRSTLMR